MTSAWKTPVNGQKRKCSNCSITVIRIANRQLSPPIVNWIALDPRIRSRLLDVNVIHHISIHAPDYRNAQINTSDQLLSRLPMYQHMTFDSFEIDPKMTHA